MKKLTNNAKILAFGDSLTFGFGAYEGYPELLHAKIGCEIINAGINGELSREGLKRLPRYLEGRYDLVILCHGANDILNNFSQDRLKENLLEMVRLTKLSGADVMLVAVPGFNEVGMYTLDLYGEVAEQEGVALQNDVMKHILSNPKYKNDFIHPNDAGYSVMCDAIYTLLKEIYEL